LQSYLKEVLSEIAVLDKKGTYNNCYHLKSQYSRRTADNESIAPVGMAAEDEEEEEVEEDEDLDDVKLEEFEE
jgi:hypothetical protein